MRGGEGASEQAPGWPANLRDQNNPAEPNKYSSSQPPKPEGTIVKTLLGRQKNKRTFFIAIFFGNNPTRGASK